MLTRTYSDGYNLILSCTDNRLQSGTNKVIIQERYDILAYKLSGYFNL